MVNTTSGDFTAKVGIDMWNFYEFYNRLSEQDKLAEGFADRFKRAMARRKQPQAQPEAPPAQAAAPQPAPPAQAAAPQPTPPAQAAPPAQAQTFAQKLQQMKQAAQQAEVPQDVPADVPETPPEASVKPGSFEDKMAKLKAAGVEMEPNQTPQGTHMSDRSIEQHAENTFPVESPDSLQHWLDEKDIKWEGPNGHNNILDYMDESGKKPYLTYRPQDDETRGMFPVLVEDPELFKQATRAGKNKELGKMYRQERDIKNAVTRAMFQVGDKPEEDEGEIVKGIGLRGKIGQVAGRATPLDNLIVDPEQQKTFDIAIQSMGASPVPLGMLANAIGQAKAKEAGEPGMAGAEAKIARDYLIDAILLDRERIKKVNKAVAADRRKQNIKNAPRMSNKPFFTVRYNGKPVKNNPAGDELIKQGKNLDIQIPQRHDIEGHAPGEEVKPKGRERKIDKKRQAAIDAKKSQDAKLAGMQQDALRGKAKSLRPIGQASTQDPDILAAQAKKKAEDEKYRRDLETGNFGVNRGWLEYYEIMESVSPAPPLS